MQALPQLVIPGKEHTDIQAYDRHEADSICSWANSLRVKDQSQDGISAHRGFDGWSSRYATPVLALLVLNKFSWLTGIEGSDLMLIDLANSVLEGAQKPVEVQTGRFMFKL